MVTASVAQNLHRRLGYLNTEKGKLIALSDDLHSNYKTDNKKMRNFIRSELRKGFR